MTFSTHGFFFFLFPHLLNRCPNQLYSAVPQKKHPLRDWDLLPPQAEEREAEHIPNLSHSAGVSLEVCFAWLLVSGTEEGEVELGGSKL